MASVNTSSPWGSENYWRWATRASKLEGGVGGWRGGCFKIIEDKLEVMTKVEPEAEEKKKTSLKSLSSSADEL